jgi:hypothetical protein
VLPPEILTSKELKLTEVMPSQPKRAERFLVTVLYFTVIALVLFLAFQQLLISRY